MGETEGFLESGGVFCHLGSNKNNAVIRTSKS